MSSAPSRINSIAALPNKFLSVVFLLVLSGCTGIPDNIAPVQDFELSRYLGTWHEVARLDHSFERDLIDVTATYSLRDDGGVTVVNRGYDTGDQKWREATGKAYIVQEADIGHLKVSFFGFFYSSYIVFELDKKEYQYAFVSGPNTNYLWLLSRKPEVDEEVLNFFLERAEALGFDTEALIYPGAAMNIDDST